MKISKPLLDKTLLSLFAGLSGKDSFVFLESIRVTPENHLSYLFLDPVERLICNHADDPAIFFSQAQQKLEQGFFLAGYLGYELGYMLEPILAKAFRPRPARHNSNNTLPLADLGVFKTPHIYDHLEKTFSGAGQWCLPGGMFSLSGPVRIGKCGGSFCAQR